jgi:hypothetical protein
MGCRVGVGTSLLTVMRLHCEELPESESGFVNVETGETNLLLLAEWYG